jgi:hypothetical protein
LRNDRVSSGSDKELGIDVRAVISKSCLRISEATDEVNDEFSICIQHVSALLFATLMRKSAKALSKKDMEKSHIVGREYCP